VVNLETIKIASSGCCLAEVSESFNVCREVSAIRFLLVSVIFAISE